LFASLLRFGITVAAIPFCANLMDGVHLIDMGNAIVLGLILAVIYTVLRPVMRLILKVFNFCTLGLLYVLVDACIVDVAAELVKSSVSFDSFWWALAVSLVINAARMLVDVVTGKTK